MTVLMTVHMTVVIATFKMLVDINLSTFKYQYRWAINIASIVHSLLGSR